MKSKNVENELIYEECLKGLSMGLADLINEKENELASNDKLIYAACSNQDAKDKYTNSELNKIAKKLKKANPTVSSYSVEILIYESSLNTNIDFNEFIILLCSNYFRENHEAIMQFSIFYSSIEEIQNDYYNGFMSRVLLGEMAELHKEFNYSEIREFIKYMALSLRNVILKSFLNDNKIESKGQSNIFVKDTTKTEQPSNVSYYEFNKLIKYFNYANCHNKTPIDLYHLFDLNFKGFKGEVLTNLISIPSDGKISYLELRKNILEEEYLHLNPDKSKIVALFQKYKLSENEFQNDKINDLKANNFFHDYITTDNDYRNDIDKPEVDEIHGVIFNYYGGITKNKAIDFIDNQLHRIDPSHISLIVEEADDKKIDINILDSLAKFHDQHKIDDERYSQCKNDLTKLLEKYCNYISIGDETQDDSYLRQLGYTSERCSNPDQYCPDCMFFWLKHKLLIDNYHKSKPFNTYQDKLNFVFKFHDLYPSLSTPLIIDDNERFTPYPSNEEESAIYLPIVFDLKEKENKKKRLDGHKEIHNIPIVSFAELKCNLYQRARKSTDVKQLFLNEIDRVVSLFPINQKNGIESTFWHIHDLKVNSVDHIYNSGDNFKSAWYVEFGPLADHYVNYYFYLKKILVDNIQEYLNSLNFVNPALIEFIPEYKEKLLSFHKSEEIKYSGKYIETTCCQTPVNSMMNLLVQNKVTHDDFKIIKAVFTDHGFWDFGELKYKTNRGEPDIMGLIVDIFEISATLSQNKQEFLKEFIKFVIHENDHPDYLIHIEKLKKQFQKKFDEIYNPVPQKVKTELSSIAYFLKLINPDDFRLRNEFGKLSINHTNKTDGRIEQANLFFIYDRLHDVFIEAKEFIRTKLMSFNDKFNQKIFLEDLREKLIYTKFYNLDAKVDGILKPIGVSFFELFDNPDKNLQVYKELKYSISLDNDNSDSIRLVDQKIDFYHQILSFWRNKAIEFVDAQLSDLVDGNNKIGNGLSNQSNDQSKEIQKEEQFAETGTSDFKETDEDFFKDDNEVDTDRVNDENDLELNNQIPKSQTPGFIFIRKLTTRDLAKIIDEHYKSLIGAGYIENCKPAFKAAYIGEKEFNKITWKKSFPELRYYIEKLSEIVENKQIWVMASSIFLKNNGDKFTNLQLQKTQAAEGPIKSDVDIDEIFTDFYSILEK